MPKDKGTKRAIIKRKIMKNTFYFKKKMGNKTVLDGFNLRKLVRVFAFGDGSSIVLLDDGHEESVKIGEDPKNKQEKRERQWKVSELYLDAKDTQRLINVTSVDGYIIPDSEAEDLTDDKDAEIREEIAEAAQEAREAVS